MTPLALVFLFAAAVDPAAVLTRVLARIRADLRHVPNYTCVETVTRQFFIPAAPVRRNCDVLLEMKKNPTLDMKLRRSHTDRLRLEVAMSSRGEIHAWVGATHFEEDSIDKIVREGPVGTGMFAAFLFNIFDQDVRTFRYENEVVVDGHERLEYSFDVPEKDSHYKVRVYESWVMTGYRGRFEIDPVTEEVTHLWVETAILPPAAGTCRTTTDLALRMTEIGSSRFPMTEVARQRYVASNGEEAVNTTRLSDCREYRGESTITYEGGRDAPASAAKSPTAAAPLSIPAGLSFTSRLEQDIDPATAAAGDRFVARLETAIRDARGRTIAPRGSRIEGRLLRVQQFYSPKAEVVVVLRPESVEVRGTALPLSAAQDLRRLVATRKRVEIVLPFKWETNAALVRREGEGVAIPKGHEIAWRTVPR